MGARRPSAERLKHLRWPLLRKGSRVRGRVRQKLLALLASKMREEPIAVPALIVLRAGAGVQTNRRLEI